MYIQKITKIIGQGVQIFNYDFPIAFAKNTEEFINMVYFLQERGLVTVSCEFITGNDSLPAIVSLTLNGWDKVDDLRKTNRINGNKCFIAMSFADDLKDIYRNGIEPAIRDAGYYPVRIDFVEHNEYIPDKIIAEIRQSRIMVADFTGQKHGVYFEAGFAMGLNISVIWTCKAEEIGQLHFDTKQISHIVWKDPEDLREKLKNRILATVP